MNNKKIFFSVLIIFCMGIFFSCTKKNTTTSTSLSFSKHILPIFATNCSISGCHIGSNNSDGHVDLTDSNAYNCIIAKSLVNVNDPTTSVLYNQIELGIMPKTPYSHLPQTQIDTILNWISQGAKNN